MRQNVKHACTASNLQNIGKIDRQAQSRYMSSQALLLYGLNGVENMNMFLFKNTNLRDISLYMFVSTCYTLIANRDLSCQRLMYLIFKCMLFNISKTLMLI